MTPSCSWVGASPDRLVSDPEKGSYGVVETKCRKKLKYSNTSRAAEETCCLMQEDGSPHLTRGNVYFFQGLR